MKSILISIKPEWVAKILNGEKIVELRKTAPKCKLPIYVYIYCTKGDYIGRISNKYVGKVVAKFTLRKVERFDFISETKYDIHTHTLEYNEEIRKHNRICKEACVRPFEVVRYLDTKCLGTDNPSGMIGYAWHISDLKIFDEPKHLSEFGLKRPPQSWQYVEEKE